MTSDTDDTAPCPYVHCRECNGCPTANGFGAFGYCATCLEAPANRDDIPDSRNTKGTT